MAVPKLDRFVTGSAGTRELLTGHAGLAARREGGQP